MSRHLNLKTLFNPKSFDRIFTRQRDEFSCAAAACATIARLYGVDPDKDLKYFRRQLQVSLTGSWNDKIKKACREDLPATKMGVNVYHGGVALGFIVHKPDGDDHAVVFLARKKDTLIYYDPVEHLIYSDQVGNMQRARKADDPEKTWTANFPDIPGADFKFWAAHAVPNPYKLREQSFWLKDHGKKLVL